MACSEGVVNGACQCSPTADAEEGQQEVSAADAQAEAPVRAAAQAEAPATVEAEGGTPATAEAQAEAPGTAEAQAEAPVAVRAEVEASATAEAQAETPVTVEVGGETPLTVEAKVETPVTAEAGVETPVTAEAKVETPVTAEAKETPVTAEAGVEARVTAETKVETPVTAEAGAEAPVTAEAEVEAPVTAEAEVEAPLMAEADVEAPVIAEAQAETPVIAEAEVEAPATAGAQAEAPVRADVQAEEAEAPATADAKGETPVTSPAESTPTRLAVLREKLLRAQQSHGASPPVEGKEEVPPNSEADGNALQRFLADDTKIEALQSLREEVDKGKTRELAPGSEQEAADWGQDEDGRKPTEASAGNKEQKGDAPAAAPTKRARNSLAFLEPIVKIAPKEGGKQENTGSSNAPVRATKKRNALDPSRPRQQPQPAPQPPTSTSVAEVGVSAKPGNEATGLAGAVAAAATPAPAAAPVGSSIEEASKAGVQSDLAGAQTVTAAGKRSTPGDASSAEEEEVWQPSSVQRNVRGRGTARYGSSEAAQVLRSAALEKGATWTDGDDHLFKNELLPSMGKPLWWSTTARRSRSRQSRFQRNSLSSGTRRRRPSGRKRSKSRRSNSRARRAPSRRRSRSRGKSRRSRARRSKSRRSRARRSKSRRSRARRSKSRRSRRSKSKGRKSKARRSKSRKGGRSEKGKARRSRSPSKRRAQKSRSKSRRRAVPGESEKADPSNEQLMESLAPFVPYCRVMMQGLVKNLELNGQHGEVLPQEESVWPEVPGCLKVRLESGVEVAVKPANLHLVAAAPAAPVHPEAKAGKHAQLHKVLAQMEPVIKSELEAGIEGLSN